MSSMPMPVDRRQASASSVSTVSAAYRRWLLGGNTRYRVDQPDPLVIAQRRLAEPRTAGHLLDGQPGQIICGDSSHALILQNLKRFKSSPGTHVAHEPPREPLRRGV